MNLVNWRGYDTTNGRRTFGVVFLIPKGRQLRIHCSDSEWSFSTKRVLVARITPAQMAQIEIKWDLIIKFSNLMIFTPSYYRVELKIECNIGENLSYKRCFAGFT